MNLDITLTEAARDYIKKMLEQKHGAVFRLSVKKTGCSGYSYFPSLVDHANPADRAIETPEGFKVYIDTAWLDLLQGLRIDYVEENKTGLKQKRLVFTNPNESSRCGCGESFHVE
ncbi:Iron-binding protein IscA [Aquicella siphonis]|uniref:Iron-binding protein IscA n=1 Tax=Aquicella siphonis TaxID=254247 RepID=A0A5E4PEF1_9COXI|nr:iron-sulfur cluster assembly accessory protein [Aquicella siphonis]VVC74741.1 Iron-binding protein IscA [Aquicella siphonis]